MAPRPSPALWEVEGLDRPYDAVAIAAVAKRGGRTADCIVLGRHTKPGVNLGAVRSTTGCSEDQQLFLSERTVVRAPGAWVVVLLIVSFVPSGY
jgi:hypothetical protein